MSDTHGSIINKFDLIEKKTNIMIIFCKEETFYLFDIDRCINSFSFSSRYN